MTSTPAILIAGTGSGVGKTTVALGIMAALRRKYSVQPFKVG
ncbi:MAG: AAA family ATPase, partial [Euryarchaeota archaeon]|nr:AAA family ATPase [Euryarchaeota archaeon]